MSRLNQIIVQGNLGRDPELRHTDSGKALCKFTLATWRSDGGTQWFHVTCWEKTANAVGENLRKGDVVTVIGRHESREHDGKTYWDLNAFQVHFGSKREADTGPRREPQKKSPSTQHTKARWDDNEIPF